MVPQDQPSPRLLNSVLPDLVAAPPAVQDRSALARGALFSGNGLAVFVAAILSCILVAAAGWFYERHTAAKRAEAVPRSLVAASTSHVSTPEHEHATPAPILVQINAEHIAVTAISLGHPRLAVINGQQVGEGDFVIVHAPTVRFEIKLRVVKIADGRIDLSDGSQIISARLSFKPLPR